jgi:CDP-diacylglycerol pyrophosphatase
LPLFRTLLWEVVHGLCVPNQQSSGNPSPCLKVDLGSGEDRGFAVVKNPFERSAIVVVPTAKIIGLEDPALLAPGARNYWADAWRQRDLVEASLGRPVARDWTAMAANSARGRSQDQLHIHVDCVSADVRRTLTRNQARLGRGWTALSFGSVQKQYLVRKVVGKNLDGINPVKLLADEVPEAGANMAEQTLVVVGAVFQDGRHGFYLLNHQADAKNYDGGSGAELLDHSCGIGP